MATEFYEVRNYKTAESKVYTAVGMALIALRTFAKQKDGWYLSRVSDGAFWDEHTKAFGKRIFTETGDLIRLQRAAERVRR